MQTFFAIAAIQKDKNPWFKGFMDWQTKAKRVMDAKGITQEELAESLKTSVAAVSRYLSGKRGKNNLELIMQIANALEVPWLVLLAKSPLDEKIFGHLGAMTDEQKEKLISFLSMASQLYQESA